MPLQKQVVPYDFTQGVDAKADPWLLQGKLTQLDNGVFAERGTISRRDGHSQEADLAGLGLGTDPLIASLGDQLLFRDKDAVRGLSSVNTLINYGSATPCIVNRRQVIRSTTSQNTFDQASINGVVLYVWVESAGLRFTVWDEETGAYFVTPYTTVSATGVAPRAIAMSDRICVFYIDSSNALKMFYVLTATPTVYTTVTIASNAAASAFLLDAVKLPSGNAAVFYRDNTSTLKLLVADSGGNIQAGWVTIAELPTSVLHVQAFTGGNILCVWAKSGTGNNRYAVYNSALTVVHAVATLVAVEATVATSIVTAGGTVQVFLQRNAVAPDEDQVYFGEVNATGTITTAFALFSRKSILMGSPFYFGTKVIVPLRHYINTTTGTFTQPTVTLAECTAAGRRVLFGTLLPGTSGKPAQSNGANQYRMASVRYRTREDGSWPVILLGEKGRLQLSTYADLSPVGFSEFELRGDVSGFDVERNRLAPVKYGRSLYFPGATLKQFDGRAVYEAGFIQYPSAVTLASVTGTSKANGTYQYCVIFEFTDGAGQLHRSAPSIPVSITISGGPKDVSVVIPYLSTTEKDVTLSVFRTTKDATIFYRASSISALANDPTATSVTFTDSVTDTALSAGELLYTTGGVLESSCPPASTFAHVHQKRLFLVLAEDENRLAYTDELVDGYGPVFNEDFGMDCGPEYGKLVGLGSIDDKLLLLRENGLQFVSGEGPDSTGSQSSFSSPQFISADTGCLSAASIVQTPDGVMFKGERGMYLVNRGLSLVWLGEPVEPLTGRIASATVIPTKSQVRFSCPDADTARVLVYDYNFRQWSSFLTQFDGYALLGQDIYALTRLGALWLEDATQAADGDGFAFAMTMETPWFKLAGVQGFQRIWRMLLLGLVEGFSTLTIEVGFDYATTYAFTTIVATSDLTAGPGPFQLRQHLPQQKCEAVRFRISCNGQHSLSPTLGAAFSNLALEVGVKSGARKLAASNSI